MNEKEQEIIDFVTKADEIYKMTNYNYPILGWEELISIVEFIENIDKRLEYYTWETDYEGKTKINYNFQGFEVDISGKECWIWLHLELDPSERVAHYKGEDKYEAVLNAVYQFAFKYNSGEI